MPLKLSLKPGEKFGAVAKFFHRFAKPVPFFRREIGDAVAFLASPVSGYTTGTVLTIDGGG